METAAKSTTPPSDFYGRRRPARPRLMTIATLLSDARRGTTVARALARQAAQMIAAVALLQERAPLKSTA